MKEFDFEELDKAVNSLMGSTADKDETVATAPAEPVTDASSSSSSAIDSTSLAQLPAAPEPTPTPNPIPESAEPPAATTPAPKSVFPTKRTGRFMDVVHPSSDMLSASTSAPPRPSRTGVSLAPLSATESASSTVSMPETSVQKEMTKDTLSSATSTNETDSNELNPTETYHEAEAPSSSTAETEWPDPLDMADKKSSTPEQAEDQIANTADTASDASTSPILNEDSDAASGTVTNSENQSSADDATSVTDTSSTVEDGTAEPEVATASPFLADAKVEKRPLGAPESSIAPEATVEKETTPENEEVDNEPLGAQTAPSVGNPPELSKEVVSVESYSTETNTDNESVTDVSSANTSTPTPQGPASISQQYKEQPSTGDAHHEAMYDAATYGQTLAHPAKNHKSLMIILAILGMVAVGVGGGALLYYLKVL